MSVYRLPIQLQRFNFVITYNLLFLYLYRLFVISVRQPLKPKLYDNHRHSGRQTQESAKIPQAGCVAWIVREHRLRNDNVGLRFTDFLSNLCFFKVDSIAANGDSPHCSPTFFLNKTRTAQLMTVIPPRRMSARVHISGGAMTAPSTVLPADRTKYPRRGSFFFVR